MRMNLREQNLIEADKQTDKRNVKTRRPNIRNSYQQNFLTASVSQPFSYPTYTWTNVDQNAIIILIIIIIIIIEFL